MKKTTRANSTIAWPVSSRWRELEKCDLIFIVPISRAHRAHACASDKRARTCVTQSCGSKRDVEYSARNKGIKRVYDINLIQHEIGSLWISAWGWTPSTDSTATGTSACRAICFLTGSRAIHAGVRSIYVHLGTYLNRSSGRTAHSTR